MFSYKNEKQQEKSILVTTLADVNYLWLYFFKDNGWAENFHFIGNYSMANEFFLLLGRTKY